MIKLNLSAIRPGMYLAKSVYNDNGELLIDKTIPLKAAHLHKLRELGITSVYVAWKKKKNQRFMNLFLEDTRRQTKALTMETLGNLQLVDSIQRSKIMSTVENLVDALLSSRKIRLHLTEIRSVDDYTFGHSVNVCAYALMLGILVGLTPSELHELGMGALFHDIGKIMVPKEILMKPGVLNPEEYEMMKTHPMKGYQFLNQIPEIPEVARRVVLDHHERMDGKGYPHGLKGDEIHLYSRIVAICDVYDALTSDRVYKVKTPPHHAIEYLTSMGNHQFDYELVKVFLKHIRIYPVGTRVKLLSGRDGIVVADNIGWPTRPIIEVQAGELYGFALYSEQIDLTKELNESIVSAC